jgi:hypothetical protein
MESDNKGSPFQNSTDGDMKIDEKPPIKLREKYQREVDQIRHEYGGLEQIRMRLGLSQRRLCLALLVDPSAWTRWLKSDAPPHVYQALRWLLELRQINPSAGAPTDLSKRLDQLHSLTFEKMKELEGAVSMLERAAVITPASGPVYMAPATNAAQDFQLEQKERLENLELTWFDEIESLKQQLRDLAVGAAKLSSKGKTKTKAKTRKRKTKTRVQRRKKAKPSRTRKRPSGKRPSKNTKTKSNKAGRK